MTNTYKTLPALLRLHGRGLLKNQSNITRSMVCCDSSLRNFGLLAHSSNNRLINASLWPKTFTSKVTQSSFHSAVTLQNLKESEYVDVTINVTFEEVVDGVEDGVLQMLDVRKPYEIKETGTIGNALNIPVQELREAVTLSDDDFEERYGFEKSELSDENLVVYCLVGLRAKAAAKILHMSGYPRVRCYPGSWEEWIEKNQIRK